MNQNAVIFKYTILAYNELKKLKYNKISSTKEDEFFNKFTKSIQKNNAFISSDILSEELANIFLNQANIICEFEALTFMPDESRLDYENTKNDLNYYINKIDHLLLKNNFEFTKNFNEHDWRILISFMATFKEWVNNIKFFEIDNEKKYEVLKESPLISICHL
jgi:hypothetical protein